MRFEPSPVIPFEVYFVIVDDNCSFHARNLILIKLLSMSSICVCLLPVDPPNRCCRENSENFPDIVYNP